MSPIWPSQKNQTHLCILWSTSQGISSILCPHRPWSVPLRLKRETNEKLGSKFNLYWCLNIFQKIIFPNKSIWAWLWIFSCKWREKRIMNEVSQVVHQGFSERGTDLLLCFACLFVWVFFSRNPYSPRTQLLLAFLYPLELSFWARELILRLMQLTCT